MSAAADRAARAARAAARRAGLVLHKTRVGEAEVDFSPVFGVDAMSLATQLTRECWGKNGPGAKPIERASIPVAFVRWSEREAADPARGPE